MTKIAFICRIDKEKPIETCKDNEKEYANRATVMNRRENEFFSPQDNSVWYFPCHKVLIFHQFKKIEWRYLKPKRESDAMYRETEDDNDEVFLIQYCTQT